MITERQRAILTEQFRLINADGITFAQSFYTRLFEEYPELKSMFRSKMSEQYAKFIGMLSILIQGIGSPVAIMPLIIEMGESHKRYGVLPHHWDVVLNILLTVIDEKLPEYANEESHEAWRSAFALMAEIMEA